jgi:propionate CoA-transferase
VLYVTERCVFLLIPEGLELAELAIGIDIERDILALMEFRPLVRDPQPMNPACPGPSQWARSHAAEPAAG